jgi:hypothetical protein
MFIDLWRLRLVSDSLNYISLKKRYRENLNYPVPLLAQRSALSVFTSAEDVNRSFPERSSIVSARKQQFYLLLAR